MVNVLELKYGKIPSYTRLRDLLREEFSHKVSEEELLYWDKSRLSQEDKELIYKHYGY